MAILAAKGLLAIPLATYINHTGFSRSRRLFFALVADNNPFVLPDHGTNTSELVLLRVPLMKPAEVNQRWLLLVALASALLVSCWFTQPAAGAVENKPPVKVLAKLPPDLALVEPNGAGFLTVRTADVWNSKLVQELRAKLAKTKPDLLKEVTKHVGLDVTQVERFTIILPDRMRQEPLVAVTTARPLAREKIVKALLKDFEEKKWGGKTCYVAKNRYGWAICFVTDRVFATASPAHLEQVLTRKPSTSGKGTLIPLLRLAAGKTTLVAGFNLEAPFFQEMAQSFIDEWRMLKPLLAARPGVLTGISNAKTEVEVRLSFAGPKQAKEAEEALERVLKLLRTQMAMGQGELERDAKRKQADGLTKWLLDKAGDFLKKIDRGLANASVRRQGSELTASMTVQAPAAEGILLPALMWLMPSPPDRGRPEPEPRPREKPFNQ
jgi:hypothetical protein